MNERENEATRRDFLKNSATTLTGAFLAPLAEPSGSGPVPQRAAPSGSGGLELPALTLAEAAERIRSYLPELDGKVGDLRLQGSGIRPQGSDLRDQTSGIRPQGSDLRPIF